MKIRDEPVNGCLQCHADLLGETFLGKADVTEPEISDGWRLCDNYCNYLLGDCAQHKAKNHASVVKSKDLCIVR